MGSNHCGTSLTGTFSCYQSVRPRTSIGGCVDVPQLECLKSTVGTINGLLFYVNMVKLNKVFFFPNGSVPVVSQKISWLKLTLVLKCYLFDGLDGYLNTWQQFAFPAYLFLLVVLLWTMQVTLCGFAGLLALMLSQH